MAYRLEYTAKVSWVGAGLGPMTLPSAQTLMLKNAVNGQNVAGAGAAGIMNGADVTSLTNAMAADIAAQMNLAANLAIINGWITGLG